MTSRSVAVEFQGRGHESFLQVTIPVPNGRALATRQNDAAVARQDHLIALATALGVDPPDAGIAD